MLSYIIPTRNRPEMLLRTVEAVGRLSPDAHASAGGAEVIVVDNASDAPVRLPLSLPNGVRTRTIRLRRNLAAAGRNVGAAEARGEWLVMLDDDSHPIDTGFIAALREAPADVAAVGAEITLARGEREAGGLPEVIIGCGAAIRSDAFASAGGYDPAFHYYAEEYDLCARFILGGMRVVHDRRFRVLHAKTDQRRNMRTILRRLVRNNGWVAARYAPDGRRRDELRETVRRYGAIAQKERARAGYAVGMAELAATLPWQRRTPMNDEQFARFTGLAAAREGLSTSPDVMGAGCVAIVDEGKNAWAVREALDELGVRVVEDEREADVVVIGTLSPGPMLDALERRAALGQRVVAAWTFGNGAAAGVDRERIASAA